MKVGKGAIKLAMIIAAAVVVVSIVVVSYLSGEAVSLESSLQALGMFVAGILTAIGIRKGGAGLAVIVLARAGIGCGSAPLHYARASLGMAESAMDGAADLIPEDAERRDDALALADSALELGDRALDVWEAARMDSPPAIWKKALVAILQAMDLVAEILDTVGVDLPEFMKSAMAELRSISRFI
jgi:hypothetical protein